MIGHVLSSLRSLGVRNLNPGEVKPRRLIETLRSTSSSLYLGSYLSTTSTNLGRPSLVVSLLWGGMSPPHDVEFDVFRLHKGLSVPRYGQVGPLTPVCRVRSQTKGPYVPRRRRVGVFHVDALSRLGDLETPQSVVQSIPRPFTLTRLPDLESEGPRIVRRRESKP